MDAELAEVTVNLAAKESQGLKLIECDDSGVSRSSDLKSDQIKSEGRRGRFFQPWFDHTCSVWTFYFTGAATAFREVFRNAYMDFKPTFLVSFNVCVC